MNIKRYNISKPKKYQDREGNEKTQWNHIGTMTEFHKDDGVSRIIEIPAIGLEANIFEQKPGEDRGDGSKEAGDDI
jgi:sortase (surface protein transpeptidase)